MYDKPFVVRRRGGHVDGLSTAYRRPSNFGGPLMQTPVFLILFLAPVYVPLELLTSWIKAAATVNPITPIVEAIRSLIAGDPQGILLAFGSALALAAVFGIWAVRGVRSAEAAGG